MDIAPHKILFPQRVNLAPVTDKRGSLIFIEKEKSIGFIPRRVYYIYGTSGRETVRGLHGHKKLQQLMIAISGSFTVRAFNGHQWREYEMNKKDEGLLFGPGLWREITNFDADAVCLVMASHEYDPLDYIHDIEEYKNYVLELGL